MKKHLYEVFAEKWCNSGTIWIYSDPHFQDLDSYIQRTVLNIKVEDGKKYYQTGDNIWENEDSLRCSMKEFDDLQVKNINSKCGKNDTLIILGDVGDVSYVKRLKAGYKVLIMGNHDKGASNYKRVVNQVWNDKYMLQCPVCHESASYTKTESPYKPSKWTCDHCHTEFKEEIIKLEDNHLFDEVYEGPVMINDRVILSHEPIFSGVQYMFNIHGHVHNRNYKGDGHHLNVCAEVINYTPVNLLNLLRNGLLKDIKSIHRMTIDVAIKHKSKNK